MTRRVNLRTSSTPQDRALPISFHALDVLQAGMGVRVFLYVRRALKAPTSLPFLGCFFSCLLGVLVGAGQALRDTLTVCVSESSITSCCSFARVFTRCGRSRNPRGAWSAGPRATPVSVHGCTETGVVGLINDWGALYACWWCLVGTPYGMQPQNGCC